MTRRTLQDAAGLFVSASMAYLGRPCRLYLDYLTSARNLHHSMASFEYHFDQKPTKNVWS